MRLWLGSVGRRHRETWTNSVIVGILRTSALLFLVALGSSRVRYRETVKTWKEEWIHSTWIYTRGELITDDCFTRHLITEGLLVRGELYRRRGFEACESLGSFVLSVRLRVAIYFLCGHKTKRPQRVSSFELRHCADCHKKITTVKKLESQVEKETSGIEVPPQEQADKPAVKPELKSGQGGTEAQRMSISSLGYPFGFVKMSAKYFSAGSNWFGQGPHTFSVN